MSGNVYMLPFQLADSAAISLNDASDRQLVEQLMATYDAPEVMAWTVHCGDQVACIWCAITMSRGRLLLTAAMGKCARTCMHSIVRKVRRCLGLLDAHRLELDVPVGYRAGNRFAQMLGFTKEAILRKYYPDHTDAVLYARVA